MDADGCMAVFYHRAVEPYKRARVTRHRFKSLRRRLFHHSRPTRRRSDTSRIDSFGAPGVLNVTPAHNPAHIPAWLAQRTWRRPRPPGLALLGHERTW